MKILKVFNMHSLKEKKSSTDGSKVKHGQFPMTSEATPHQG